MPTNFGDIPSSRPINGADMATGFRAYFQAPAPTPGVQQGINNTGVFENVVAATFTPVGTNEVWEFLAKTLVSANSNNWTPFDGRVLVTGPSSFSQEGDLTNGATQHRSRAFSYGAPAAYTGGAPMWTTLVHQTIITLGIVGTYTATSQVNCPSSFGGYLQKDQWSWLSGRRIA